MTGALPIPPEKLLAETRWLRGLAASLAQPDEADDLAQDAWLRALEQPPGGIRGLRPWLTTVVRRAFARSRQDAGARIRREHAVARAEAVPSTVELAARASLQRALVAAVLSLDEPGRATVLLRFFDDRPPREIARIQGVPVETVRTRLKRALAVLRAKLDRDHGGRESWIRAVTPILGGVLMSTKSKVAVAAACVLLLVTGAAVAWRELGAPSPAPQSPAAPPESPPPPAAAAPAPLATSVASRTVESAPVSRPVADAFLRPPIRFVVHVSNERGDDVAGAAVVLSGKDVSGTTDARGEAALGLPAPGVATIRTAAQGFEESVLDVVPLTGGSRIQVDLVPLATLRIRVEDRDHAPVPDAPVTICSSMMFADADIRGVIRHTTKTDDGGTATFAAIPVREWTVRVRATGFVDWVSHAATQKFPMVGPGDATIVLERGAELTVRFVHAATGGPVPGVYTCVAPDQSKWHMNYRVASDESGIVLVGRPEGVTSRIELDGNAFAERNETLVPPDQKTVTIRMSDPAPLVCLVKRQDETRVTAAILEYDRPPRAFPVAASDGRYQVEGQGYVSSPFFRFVASDGATSWRRLVNWKPEITAILNAAITIKGQTVTPEGAPVAGALIMIDPRMSLGVAQERGQWTEALVTAQSDGEGRFSAQVGGDAYHLVEVVTAAGTCARRFAAGSRSKLTNWTPAGDAPSKVPVVRADANGLCDLGQIFVPSRTGNLHVMVGSIAPGGSEAIVTPLGALTELFPSRRAPVRTNLTAAFAGLPEGEYDVSVIGGRGGAFVPGLFGSWGTRVAIVADKTAEVRVAR